MELYESKCQTYRHKQKVSEFMNHMIKMLMDASLRHDDSKLGDFQSKVFADYTDKLATCTYGSDEYKTYLKEMKIALDLHYAEENHHPEHFGDKGIRGMSLINLVEMICDWKAASLRHNDGDIMASIDKNQERFGYSDELAEIFKNTAKLL